MPVRRRHTSVVVVAVASILAVVPASAGATCGTGGPEAETLCLINAERTARSLRPLVGDAELAEAARSHSAEMVAEGYFRHRSPSGDRVDDRVRRTGFLHGYRRWRLGEILAWGTGPLASPAAIVRAWMRSPPHRALMLRAGFRRIGIGASAGTPAQPHEGETYTAGLGRRSRRPARARSARLTSHARAG